jgi:Fe2+ or Zn2+ uptake regulation protein
MPLTLDVSILDQTDTWKHNPEYVRAAVATGHHIDCDQCHRVIGIGKDDEAARADVQLNRTGVRINDKHYCTRCGALSTINKRK